MQYIQIMLILSIQFSLEKYPLMLLIFLFPEYSPIN